MTKDMTMTEAPKEQPMMLGDFDVEKDKKTTAAINSDTDQGIALRKRIDKTTYIVRVHFSDTAKETFEDKIRRMIRDEASRV